MYKLRGYQKDAVSQTIKYFQKKRQPAVIVLPTGAGKSLVIAELAKLALGRVLVLAHVKELVEQNHAKFESYGLSAGIYSAGLNKKRARIRLSLAVFNLLPERRRTFSKTSVCSLLMSAIGLA